MFKKPPNWEKHFSTNLIQKSFLSEEFVQLIKKAEKEYVYWDKFKYYPIPKEFSQKEAWAFLKFSRISNREYTPVKSVKGKQFSFNITKTMFHQISMIDSNTSGFLTSEFKKPTTAQKNELIISGLTEEAIASSQIEGANTSRKAAKLMLLSKRKAITKDEQMIINNYQVMQRLLEWKDLDLSEDMLIEIQKNITINTLEDENDVGRFRTDDDDIGVVNRNSGEVVFTPTNRKTMLIELKKLIKYANTEDSEENFIHPVIKASILHFWLAYLHPFVDGNGRTARALFYWYMLKKNYWMFQYLSVSRIIKKSKKKYDDSFIYAEIDDDDLTYFLSYHLRAIILSLRAFTQHYEKKLEKDKIIEKIAIKSGEFNERQISLLQSLNEHKDARIDIHTHQSKHRIVYQTARVDLLDLESKNLITRIKVGKKFLFIPNTIVIKKLIE